MRVRKQNTRVVICVTVPSSSVCNVHLIFITNSARRVECVAGMCIYAEGEGMAAGGQANTTSSGNANWNNLPVRESSNTLVRWRRRGTKRAAGVDQSKSCQSFVPRSLLRGPSTYARARAAAPTHTQQWLYSL
jgi:hypothetical protein